MNRPNRLPLVAMASALLMGLSVAPGLASSHREAPLIAGEPQLDNTDLYAFVSPDKRDTVTIIANGCQSRSPTGGPNFYPFSNNAKYNVHVDNNHDAKADLTYQWRFKSSYQNPATFLYNTGPVNSLNDPTLNFRQTYTLTRIDMTKNPPETQTLATDVPTAPSHVGNASMPNYQALRNQAIISFGASGKSFAGQADDPFFLDLRVFDLLYGTNLKEAGNDTLDNYNVNSIALQLPKSDLALGGDATANPIVGIYTDTEAPAVTTRNPDGTQAHLAQLRPRVSPRHPPGQRGGHRPGPQGQDSTPRCPPMTASTSNGSRSRCSPSSSRRSTRSRLRPSPATTSCRSS